MTQIAAGKGNTSLPRWAVVLVHVLFFFSGAAGLVYEVVWMRMLSFVFGNTTYAVSVVLATFLGGLAIGAWAYGRVADRRSDLLKVYGMLEVGAAAIALAMPFLLLGVLTPVYTWVYQRAGESAVALT
ncbi:MAG: spermidine synthase, partial [Armatimonadota bacterium]|nr:spermidine synthase [Armatimonadota bacterium]